MARGNVVREWTCDSCNKTERLAVTTYGENETGDVPGIESWQLPSGWFRLRIETPEVNVMDDPMAERVVEVCNRCYGSKLGDLERIEEKLYPAPVHDDPPPVDLGTRSEYEKLHGTTTITKAPKGDGVSFNPGGIA